MRAAGVIIDPEDAWLLVELTWGVDRDGYIRGYLNRGKRTHAIALHHCIIGQPIVGIVKFRNKNKRDVRRENIYYTDGRYVCR